MAETENKTIVDDFEIGEEIAHGGFSVVRLAKYIPTGTYAAVKIVNLKKLNENEFNGIMREFSVFMQVYHPNIISIYRVSVVDDLLYFFMEYASNGTLLDYVNSNKGLKEPEVQRLFIQIFDAVRHIHMKHFLVHRDLKLENILLDSNNNVKITDFGFAGTYYNYVMRTIVGTTGYMPPEILAGNDYNEKCDVWSLGVCLYAMLTGSFPFVPLTQNYRVLIEQVERMKFPPTFSPQLVDILKKMLQIKANLRPTLFQLQSHPWLRGLQKQSMNITPSPIRFYQVNDTSSILKFRRSPQQVDPKILEEMKSMNIDVANLESDLKRGQVNQLTTTYFTLLKPLKVKPIIKKEEPKKIETPKNVKTRTTPAATSSTSKTPAKGAYRQSVSTSNIQMKKVGLTPKHQPTKRLY